jgi:hypothetical protein
LTCSGLFDFFCVLLHLLKSKTSFIGYCHPLLQFDSRRLLCSYFGLALVAKREGSTPLSNMNVYWSQGLIFLSQYLFHHGCWSGSSVGFQWWKFVNSAQNWIDPISSVLMFPCDCRPFCQLIQGIFYAHILFLHWWQREKETPLKFFFSDMNVYWSQGLIFLLTL